MTDPLALLCDQCKARIQCYVILDSEVWEQISRGAYALCVFCTEARLQEIGLRTSCDLALTESHCLTGVQTERVKHAGAWRPRGNLEFQSVGLPNLYKGS